MTSKNRQAGLVRTITGHYVNVADPKVADLHIYDIAWNLGRILRYNGATRQDYTVAHHSVIMSYYVPPDFAMEALLHDAGEAYMGDIIWPVKALFPEIEALENKLTGRIMDKFDKGKQPFNGAAYAKSLPVSRADSLIFDHECFSFGDRPGIYSDKMQNAWNRAVENADGLWHAPMYPFMYRFHELAGTGLSILDINMALEQLWFNYDEQATEGLTQEQMAAIGECAAEMENP